MFIERLRPIDLGEPIYGRKTIGCAPKGAAESQLSLPIYKHFTATRFLRQAATDRIYDYCAPSFLSISAAFEFPGFIFNDFL